MNTKCFRLILRNVQVIQYKTHNNILVHIIYREFVLQNKKCLDIQCSPDNEVTISFFK